MMPSRAHGPTSNKHKKKTRTKKNTTADIEMGPKIFDWTTKHWDAFDALKEALSTGLSQLLQGVHSGDRCFFEWSRYCPITIGQGWRNPCSSICKLLLMPLRKSMYNYSSVKRELLMLKWAVMEKFWDYLLGS